MRTSPAGYLIFFALCALMASSGEKVKKIVPNEAGNDNLDITANLLLERDRIHTALGEEMPEGIVAVEVKLVPKGDGTLSISRDDFVLLSHRDGQRSGPYSPGQIAGSTTMVVKTRTQAGVGGQGNGPSWGGIPGTGGRPRRMDGDGASAGSTTTGETKTSAEIKEQKTRNNPLLKALADHMLAEKETKDPVTGLLYFPLEGKVKNKDLELIYTGPAGRLYIDFH